MRIFSTGGSTTRGIRLIEWPIFIVVLGLILILDGHSPFTILLCVLLGCAFIVFLWWNLVVEAPGEVHIDPEGLSFHKRGRSVAVAWDDIERTELTPSKRHPVVHVMLREPIPDRGDHSLFFWNMVDFHREDHFQLDGSDWEPQDVVEIHHLINHRLGDRDSE